MNKKILKLSIILSLLAGSAIAQDVDKMKQKLNKSFPLLGVEDVEYIKNINLYELKIKDSKVLSYTNENNDYFLINGEIIDVKNKINYTQERDFYRVKMFFRKLPTDKAITISYGKGTRKMAVFTDPDCPYCKALDKEIHTNLTKSDITIYYYMNPLNIPGHEQAPLKAAKIWCDKDKGKAWINWMLKDILPNNPGTCKNPVAETKKFATNVGFNGTPTIIFDNGFTANQQLTAEQILKVFDNKKP